MILAQFWIKKLVEDHGASVIGHEKLNIIAKINMNQALGSIICIGDCNIPGNATLVYDVNLTGIYKGNRNLPGK